MRILHLPTFWTILLDCLAWAIIQPAVAYLCLKLPTALLQPQRWLFRARRWERDGALYQDLFRVKRWKVRLPSGGALFRGFAMTGIRSRDPAHLQEWVRETCRSELCHWLAILPAGLFFLWNSFSIGLVMILYAVAFNLPLVVVQRYNRPRLLQVLQRRRQG